MTLRKRLCLDWVSIAALLALVLGCGLVTAADRSCFHAVQCPVVAPQAWAILDRDGANRPTEPYLSSLARGEAQTGKISSPPFVLPVDTVRFTIRGHDGMGGGRGQNYIALVDNKTGLELRKSPAPGNDALVPLEWNVADLKGRTVRIELVDGLSENAFAWLGVEKIEAGTEMTVDFRQGIPQGWQIAAPGADEKRRPCRVVDDGPVPFRVDDDAFTWIPEQGAALMRIGCPVERVFLLGATVPAARALQTYGRIDIVYADKSKEAYPLVYGFTLESAYKTATAGSASFVLPVGDGTQYLLAIAPKNAPIERIELRRAAPELPRPRVSAITCQLGAATEPPEGLEPLDPVTASASDAAWLASHTLAAEGPTWLALADEIRRERGVPVTLDEVQRLEEPAKARFVRKRISERAFEAASVCDVDGDGKKDIVSGEYWYAGPDFSTAVKFRTIQAISGYHDSFHDYPMDVNGDGRPDIVSGGWFGKTLSWCENPAGARSAGEWTAHVIDEPGSIETSRFWDVDGDGHVEIVPNAAGNVVFYRLVRDASGRGTGKFDKHVVRIGGCGHGLGFGDVNGDGRGDFIIPTGWLESPPNPLEGEWKLHAEFTLQHASVPILVCDVNEDGRADLIYGNGHGYGLFWVEQKVDQDGNRAWTQHTIDDQASQYHDMLLADIDGDQRLELVTGKRYYAHNGSDPGAEDPVFVRYFDFDKRGVFTSHTIDYGKAREHSGVGIYFWVEDVDGDNRPDIIAPGKEGLFLFENGQ